MQEKYTESDRERPCDKKEGLFRDYIASTTDYGRCVQMLQKRLGVLSKTEYEKLRRFSEQTRHKSEEARTALDRHVKEHSC